MSRPRDIERIQHMLDHAIEAHALAKGHSRADLESDRLLNLALVRLLEIVGEAAGRVSDETRTAFPEVPWRQIADLRNRLIHGYDDVTLTSCGRSCKVIFRRSSANFSPCSRNSAIIQCKCSSHPWIVSPCSANGGQPRRQVGDRVQHSIRGAVLQVQLPVDAGAHQDTV